MLTQYGKYLLSGSVLLSLLCHQTAFAGRALAADAALPQDNYPRITAMEATILGKAYADALTTRLARLEIKAFGKATDKAALSDRTDKLEGYVEETYHKQLFVPAPGYQGADDDQVTDGSSVMPASATGGGSYPRVTALEQAIVGQIHEGDQLKDRLSRMELSAFTKDAPDAALGDRTDALEDYAEKKLHKKILGQSSTTKDNPDSGGNAAASGGAGGGGGILAKMGSALLGLPQGGSGGPSFFSPGFGPFAGVRVRPRNPNPDGASAEQPVPSSHLFSPADEATIKAATAPPPAARTPVKVAWCEQRVFGHISTQKHLPERLDLLNMELNFAPGKNSTQLMDDIDNLVKLAARRPPSPVQ